MATNMFIYCGNNPVMYVDESGLFFDQIGKFFSDVGNAIIDGFNKFVHATKKSTEVEIGGGFGIGAKVNIKNLKGRAEIVPYGGSFTFSERGVENNTWSKAGIVFDVTKLVKLGLDYKYTVPTESVNEKGMICNSDGKFSGMAGVKIVDFMLGIESENTDDLILSYGLGAYAIVGGEATISVNINEFIREWDNVKE